MASATSGFEARCQFMGWERSVKRTSPGAQTQTLPLRLFSGYGVRRRPAGRRILPEKLFKNGQVAIHHTSIIANFLLERLQLRYRRARLVANVLDRELPVHQTAEEFVEFGFRF